MNVSEATRTIQKEGVKEIALQFTDLSGLLHSLWVPSSLLPKIVAEGVHMDGSSVDMVDISESDLKLMPRLDTFVVLPSSLFAQRVARVLCDICQPESERPFELDPTFVLRRIIDDSGRPSEDRSSTMRAVKSSISCSRETMPGTRRDMTREGTWQARLLTSELIQGWRLLTTSEAREWS